MLVFVRENIAVDGEYSRLVLATRSLEGVEWWSNLDVKKAVRLVVQSSSDASPKIGAKRARLGSNVESR